MPILHKYKDRTGFYIRTTFAEKNTPKGQRRIVTYRVTTAGEEYLQHPGCLRRPRGEGSEISYDELKLMQRRGYLTTEGTGPGLIESPPTKEKRGCGCQTASTGILITTILCVSAFMNLIIVENRHFRFRS